MVYGGVREGFSAWILRGNGMKKEPQVEALGWMFMQDSKYITIGYQCHISHFGCFIYTAISKACL